MTAVLNIGGEGRVNTVVVSHQEQPAAAALSDGGYVVVWASAGEDGDASGIYGQRYTAAGIRVGGEFHVSTTTAGAQITPDVAGLADGGFVVTWMSADADGNGIFCQRFSDTGGKLGGETPANLFTTGSQAVPSVTETSDGGYVIAWQSDGEDGSGTGIFAERFTAGGIRLGNELHVNSTTAGNQLNADIAGLADGGFVAVWQGAGTGDTGGIFMQRYGIGGLATGVETRSNTTTVGDQSAPKVATLASGEFVVVWQSAGTDGNRDIVARLYASDGSAETSEIHVNTTTVDQQQSPDVVALDDGGFVVSWSSAGQDGSVSGVFAQRFDTFGEFLGNEFQVNKTTFNFQDDGHLVALAGGGFAAVWESFDQDGAGYGIFQRVWGHTDDLTGTQYLYGTEDADELDGGAGADVMYGGNGDDTYYVNSATDQVVERAFQGEDTVVASTSWLLGANFENLILAGTSSLVGNGNGGDNIIEGNGGTNGLNGLGGDDSIYGHNGNDALSGGTGDDYLDGGAGNDSLTGAVGSDQLYGGDGNDRLEGDDGDDYADGGSGNDLVRAGNGNDTAVGGDGTDTFDGAFLGNGMTASLASGAMHQNGFVTHLSGFENLTGSDFADTLTGDGFDNVITGGLGADTMAGGAGDDSYFVDDAGDVVQEATGKGDDIIFSSVSYSLAGQFVESLTLTGDSNINATANSHDSTLTGNTGNNILTGSFGNDTLDGRNGTDTMIGGAGNDTFVVDNTGDIVVEADGGGTDTIFAAVSYSLAGRFVETLQFTGINVTTGTGNSKANTLIGSDGDNTLDGKGGADTLTGGFGADVFLFTAASGEDTIEDFTAAQNDTININAFSHGVVNGGGVVIVQDGADVKITLSSGNIIHVLNTSASDPGFLNHITW